MPSNTLRDFWFSTYAAFCLLRGWPDFFRRASTREFQRAISQAVRGYRCNATTVEGFVQQLACCYLRHGYWFYVMGKVPEWKDPATVDEKLIAKYGIAISESTRRRRKKLGLANLQYLRYCRLFVILATAGKHPFREIEAGAVRDIRRVPIKIWGYSISYRPGGRTRKGERDPRWHSHVEIERERYKELRDHLVDLAVHRNAEQLALEFYHLPFEPYAPIRRQMLNILRAVNRRRKAAGFSQLPATVLPLRRRIVQPFGFSYRELAAEEPRPKQKQEGDNSCQATESVQTAPAHEGESNAAADKPTEESH